jgi:predicted ATPase
LLKQALRLAPNNAEAWINRLRSITFIARSWQPMSSSFPAGFTTSTTTI